MKPLQSKKRIEKLNCPIYFCAVLLYNSTDVKSEITAILKMKDDDVVRIFLLVEVK